MSGETHTSTLCRIETDGRLSCHNGIANGRDFRRSYPRPIVTDTRFVALAAAASATCGITRDRTVSCWGPSQRVVTGLVQARALALRPDLGCALVDGGSVACWSMFDKPFAARIEGLPLVTAIAANERATCALSNEGRVFCWGIFGHAWPGHSRAFRAQRPLDVRLPEPVVALEGEPSRRMCARLRSGTLQCWGGADDTWDEQRWNDTLGDTATVESWPSSPAVDDWDARRLEDGRVLVRDRARPHGWSVLGDLPLTTALVHGSSHTCVLAHDGRAWCWGNNTSGQLGLNDEPSDKVWTTVMIERPRAEPSSLPAQRSVTMRASPMPPDRSAASPYRAHAPTTAPHSPRTRPWFVLAGLALAAVLAASPRLLPPPPRPAGPLSIRVPYPITRPSDDPMEPLRDVIGFSVNDASVVAIVRDGRAYGLENTNVPFRDLATPIARPPWTALVSAVRGYRVDRDYDAMEDTTFIVSRCLLIDATHEQCGASGIVETPPDRRAETRDRWPDEVLCRRNADTTLSCHGLSTGRRLSTSRPHRAVAPLLFRTIAAAENATCGLTREGTVACWGATPTTVLNLEHAQALVVAHGTGCALTSDGRVACWPVAGKRIAAVVEGLPPAVSLVASATDLCIETAAHTHWCWDDDHAPHIVSAPTPAPPPQRAMRLEGGRVLIATLAGWAALADLPPIRALTHGDAFDCALAENGEAWCWGSNQFGQLGLDDHPSDKAWSTVMVARATTPHSPM